MSSSHLKIILPVFLLSFHLTSAKTKKDTKPPPQPPVNSLIDGQFTFFLKDKYEIFDSIVENKLILSSSCKNRKCDARDKSKVPLAYPEVKRSGMFSPGPAYCEAMKGKPFIAFNKKGETFDFCRFQDGSMLDSWSALFVHYPKKVIR